jgi:hypothetical protein
MSTTDLSTRQAFITGLRDLADYLDQHPAVAIPEHGTDILPTNPGECQLIAEGGVPQRVKVSSLSDADITALADYAAWTRRTGPHPTAGPAPPRAGPPPPPKGTPQ